MTFQPQGPQDLMRAPKCLRLGARLAPSKVNRPYFHPWVIYSLIRDSSSRTPLGNVCPFSSPEPKIWVKLGYRTTTGLKMMFV